MYDNPALFFIAAILLAAGLVAVVYGFMRSSRSAARALDENGTLSSSTPVATTIAGTPDPAAPRPGERSKTAGSDPNVAPATQASPETTSSATSSTGSDTTTTTTTSS